MTPQPTITTQTTAQPLEPLEPLLGEHGPRRRELYRTPLLTSYGRLEQVTLQAVSGTGTAADCTTDPNLCLPE